MERGRRPASRVRPRVPEHVVVGVGCALVQDARYRSESEHALTDSLAEERSPAGIPVPRGRKVVLGLEVVAHHFPQST